MKRKVYTSLIYLCVTPQMLLKHGWQMSVGGDRKTWSHRVYLHVSIRAGLSAGQRSTLGHGYAALTHLTAKVIPLVSHWALQGTVFSQVRAGVIWKGWEREVIWPWAQQSIKKAWVTAGLLTGTFLRWAIIFLNMPLLLSNGHQIRLTVWAKHSNPVCYGQYFKAARSSMSEETHNVHALVGQPLTP